MHNLSSMDKLDGIVNYLMLDCGRISDVIIARLALHWF